jgi:hypothetical protein
LRDRVLCGPSGFRKAEISKFGLERRCGRWPPTARSPARGPPTDWGGLVQVHNECDATQTSPDELPAIDIHSL